VKSPEAVQQELAASSSSDGAKIASTVSEEVLKASHLVVESSGLKLEGTPSDACPSPISLSVDDSQLQISGGCTAETTTEGCVYRFDGLLTFHDFQLAPQKVLEGVLNVILTVTAPTCSLGDSQTTVALSATSSGLSPLTLNGEEKGY
jgi:hypothetical protein